MYKQNFINGRMNLDADIRLLPKGDHREAYNIEALTARAVIRERLKIRYPISALPTTIRETTFLR